MNRHTPLFREEAVKAQQAPGLGTINLAAPVSFSYWVVLAAAVTLIVILLLIFGNYTRRQTISGQLLPSSGLLSLTSQTTGTVTRIFVREGESVLERQPLAEISGDLDSASMGGAHALVSSQLQAQKVQMRSMLSSLQLQAEAQRKDIQARIGMLHEQQKAINEQLVLARQVAAASTKRLEIVEPVLRQGIISAIQLDQYHASALSDRVRIKELDRQLLDTMQQLSVMKTQLTQLPLETSSKASQIQGQLAQLNATLAENEAARKTVLRAPRAGAISNFLVTPGQNVVAGQPLISILPKESKLEAQLLVPSSAIGFIKVGNSVALRYEAYPYQKFGVQYGHVRQISHSALNHSEAKSLLGQDPGESFYRVLVDLNQQVMLVDGRTETLKPGMALGADILLERRNLWQWVFAPLYGLRQQLKFQDMAQ